MNPCISVVINTLNEQKHIKQAIESALWADEILVCDMHSDDDTAVIAKKMGAKVIFHKRLSYVEPARNFAISKASGDWIFILDADEQIPKALADRLRKMVKKPSVSTYVEIPRKNIIFGKWVKASFWWPDYHIRFFKKDAVLWNDRIHSKPKTTGQGLTLEAQEQWAIIHHHYQTVSQFITRMDRYTSIQANDLSKDGVRFEWPDLIKKPLSEFLGRYFANRGYEDGVHGLALSLLQAVSFLVVYLKLWELQGFESELVKLSDLKDVKKQAGFELNYWFKQTMLSKNPIKRTLQKVKNKILA